MTTLTSNGLSRILEIPLTLLDKADSNEMSMKNTANQMFWISTNNTPKAPTSSATNSTNTDITVTSGNTTSITKDNSNNVNTAATSEVTHSFANRKRSIVKRRKSVLSAVFTAEEEAEEIQSNREEALEALEKETTSSSHQTSSTKKEEYKKRRNKKITLGSNDTKEEKEDYSHRHHHSTPKMVNIMMNDIDTKISPVSRGLPLSNDTGGVKSKFQRSLTEAPSPTATTTTTVYIQSQNYTDAVESNDEETEREATNATPKDSAIDLGVIGSVEKCIEIDSTTRNLQEVIKYSSSSIDNTLIDLTIPPNTLKEFSLPPPTPTFNLSPTKSELTSKTKKKVSSWSPRRIFQSSENTENSLKKKKSSACIAEEKTKHFNISSLFSRTSLSSSTTSSHKKSTDNKGRKTTSKSVLLSNSPGASDSNKDISSTVETSKKDIQLNGYNHTRLPIHTERAIYRLSHLKLSNPRRPLCDQVTISNLMFWYLSIISQQNNSIENEFTSTSSLGDPTSAGNNGFTEKENNAMIKKVSRIKLQQQQPRRGGNKKYTSNNINNRRIRNHQIGPATTYSNAMDTLKQKNQQHRLPSIMIRGKHSGASRRRSTNSSSEEEDDEEDDSFSDDEISDDGSLSANSVQDDDEGIMTDLFSKSTNNNSWLPSFASPKQHNVIIPHQDEDDIPLAMYQKGKA
ncbi:unnamed protein product [Mucor hiemalis]